MVDTIFTLTDKQGEYMVKLARQVIMNQFEPTDIILIDDPVLQEKCGVFVTLTIDDQLRGCIGLPYPTSPLLEAVVQAANSAAFEDPRFPSVQPKEMNDIVIEVSVLTPPEKLEVLDPRDLPFRVKVGRDGLIIGRGWQKGLLLPQVPVEWGWDSKQFLSQCCVKAGLPQNSWLKKEVDVLTFQAILFKEDSPKGIIRRHRLVNN